MRAAPAVSCAKMCEKNAHEHTGSAEAIRPSLRNGFTAYAALSPATNSFCHRHRRIEVCRTRLGSKNLRRLDISNGCQDHAVLPYALAPFVCMPAYRSRASPPCDYPARRRCRVHRIPPRVRDDREPPLLSGETGGFVEMICPTSIADYFASEDWTGQIMLESFGKLLSGRIEKSTGK